MLIPEYKLTDDAIDGDIPLDVTPDEIEGLVQYKGAILSEDFPNLSTGLTKDAFGVMPDPFIIRIRRRTCGFYKKPKSIGHSSGRKPGVFTKSTQNFLPRNYRIPRDHHLDIELDPVSDLEKIFEAAGRWEMVEVDLTGSTWSVGESGLGLMAIKMRP